MSCWFALQNTVVTSTNKGFKLSACCSAKSIGYTNSLQDLKNCNKIKDFRKSILQGQKPKECESCWRYEREGLESKRTRSLHLFDKYPANVDSDGTKQDDVLSWDIRPESVCNLKCVMCNPHLSSKWEEDREIYNQFFSASRNKQLHLDWDYIYKNTVGKATRIYISGGEPFYIKGVVSLLEKLSENNYNIENTKIIVQTNGTTFNSPLIDILSKFKKLDISVSIDGTYEVDNIIRYPGSFSKKLQAISVFKELNCHLTLSTTVGAMNLPNVENIQELFPDIKMHCIKLLEPSILNINALKPEIVDKVSNLSYNKDVKAIIKDYKYSSILNDMMQRYLKTLDKKRNTDSKKTLPWCFV